LVKENFSYISEISLKFLFFVRRLQFPSITWYNKSERSSQIEFLKVLIMRISLLIAGFLLVGLFGVAVAQNEVLPAKPPLPELPDPGQKPGDFFYFLDQWIESLGEFFTFNPEAKALLQTERALERIAEVKALLEVKGIDDPGLDVAQEKIQAHMARASQIVKQQKTKGKEVAQLAQKLDDDFDAGQELLKQTFKAEKARLDAQKEEIKLQILQARQAGDFEKVGQLRTTLAGIETQKEALEGKWEAQEESLELEEEKLEAELGDEEKELEELEEQEEDVLDQKEEEIERAFEQRERALELQEKSLEIDLKKAILEGDTTKAEQIRAQLLDLVAQKEALEEEEEAAEKTLEKEKKELEKVRDLKERAEEQIKKAQEEIADVREEMAEIVEVPPAASQLLIEAESKLSIAKTALEDEDYGEAYGQAMAAEMLAKNAEKKIEQEGKELEELEEKLEKKGEAEASIQEVKEKLEQTSDEEKAELEERLKEAEKESEERGKDLEEIEGLKEKLRTKSLERLEELEGVEEEE